MADQPDNYVTLAEEPVLLGDQTYGSVTATISDTVLRRPPGKVFLAGLTLTLFLLLILSVAVAYLFYQGVGIWGVNVPVAWGFAITNFVWWIGIGHAGTFISAFLLLLRQPWRTSINRFAEAMTLFAVMCAGMFPLLHLGRPWFFYWLAPYPNVQILWPQFRSALVWDVFAVSTYFTISLLFWYIGLIPDLATLRDRAQSKAARWAYGFFALGWRGAARHWHYYHWAYLLLAALAAPLVISVHSVVSMDFAEALVPGWHTTLFPPYFVAGAIFSGFAMVITLAVPIRHFFGLQHLITRRHLDNCAKLTLITGLIVAYGYAAEAFMAWYSDDPYEWHMMCDRALGNYAWGFWIMIACNVLTPQLLWFKRIRNLPVLLFVLSLLIQWGMWTERFVIIIQSLHQDFLPSAWRMYYPTLWDYLTLFGTIGFFAFMFLLFCRFLPVISISEVRELVKQTQGEARSLAEAQAETP